MPSASQVIIVIPIYNEASVISTTLAELFKVATRIPEYRVGVLVFDSHSTDGSAAVVTALQAQYPKLYLASEPHKTGLGSAYHQAFQIALHQLNADVIVEFDADGSHQPKYLPDMLAKIHKGADVVVGSRYVGGGSIPKDWA
ncbi:MAG: glycosyltransferase [Gammaproteobacteria bacterium]|nr:glycosyltransferase [Gammaproteobacteria bacterium]